MTVSASRGRDWLGRDLVITASVQVALKLRGFVFLSLLAKTFGSEGFGVWSQINATTGLLGGVAMLGLDSALIRLLPDATSKARIRGEFIAVVAIVGGTAGCLAIALCVAATTPWGRLAFGAVGPGIGVVAGATLVVAAVNTCVMQYLRAFTAVRAYAALTWCQVAIEIVALATCAAFKLPLVPSLAAVIATRMLVVVLGGILALGRGQTELPSRSCLLGYLSFGLPLIPLGLLMWVVDSSDRLLVGYYVGVDKVGIYAAAYLLASVVFLVAAPMSFMVFPYIADLCRKGLDREAGRATAEAMKLFSVIAVPIVFSMPIMVPDLLKVAASPEFIEGRWAMGIVAAALFVFVAFGFAEYILTSKRETGWVLRAYGWAALVNVAANIVLIPVAGITGSASATAAAYVTYAGIVTYRARSLVPYEIPWRVLILHLVAGVGMCGVVSLLRWWGYASVYVLGPASAFGYLGWLTALGGLPKDLRGLGRHPLVSSP